MRAVLATTLAVSLLPSLAYSQADPAMLRLNEVYASHAGTDDMEMIELIGIPNTPLTNYMVAIVEGDGGGAGTLDRAWDLSSFVMPADGYFVLANTAETMKDLDIGLDNIIENGTETVYVLQAGDANAVASILGLVGTNVDGDADLVTDLVNFALIRDHIGIVDSGFGTGDMVYDNAPVAGPDGSFLPAGIFRNGDYPNPWCDIGYLDFDDVANSFQPRTPHGKNGGCYYPVGPGCADSNGRVPTLNFSGESLPGANISLDFSDVTPPNPALLFVGFSPLSVNLNANCLFYVGAPSVSIAFGIPAPAFSIPASLPAGSTGLKVYVQLVAQDGPGGPGITSNGMLMSIQ